MKVKLVRSLWGVSDGWETSFPRIKGVGYAAIECVPPPADQRERFTSLLKQHRLGYVALIYTTGTTVQDHITSFKTKISDAQTLDPLLINSQCGRDAFDESDAIKYFKAALAFECDLDIEVCHENHRTRIFYNPWITGRMLNRFPTMKFCADYSHWVVVTERLLDDCTDILTLCATRCIHIHARVGYEEGPQTPDPRAPEYARHLQAHERWWKQIYQAQAAQNRAALTLVPEFGGSPYLHTLPYTGAPVANVDDVCNWIAKRQARELSKP